MREISEEELVKEMRDMASEYCVSLLFCLKELHHSLEFRKNAITNTVQGPWPIRVVEERLESDDAGRPEWTENVVPAGSKFELHVFADGRKISKLVCPRGRVLLAEPVDDLSLSSQ